MNQNNAVVLIDKESGVTSFRCLGTVKHCINKKTGHCGTLDRFATGLIIACCGKYTKKVPLFMGLDKKYVATIRLGIETDTLDPEGETVQTGIVPDADTLESAIREMTGTMMQKPPVYSALHINGKRSYELARKGVSAEPEAREITVFNAELLMYEPPFARVELHVSKGTYVRSWARDLGYKCGTCAYVTQLRRTQIGPFSVDEAVKSDDENSLCSFNEDFSENLIHRLTEYDNSSVY
ncbi:MAG: tRNA pseudouridine(55) synthase TruB, partial [Sphaerochaetaceae bacterium]|nr:tRNA pseudouridine(55) synthase TruB [Sphaerochaetaceae bacterium]